MVAERDEPTGALVRPYAVTRGRTRPRLDIALEALVETTVRGRNSVGPNGPQHGREQQYIASLCDGLPTCLVVICHGAGSLHRSAHQHHYDAEPQEDFEEEPLHSSVANASPSVQIS